MKFKVNKEKLTEYFNTTAKNFRYKFPNKKKI